MRGFDFSSWSSVLTTLLGLALFALIGVGIRLVFMLTLQQRRERLNRQINERLKLLIAAYKVLGGSFTGTLIVDPRHRRDYRTAESESPPDVPPHFERARQIRDAVEAALSDIILLGTEDQVRLAATAAVDLAAGRPVETAALVASLRDFIRKALDLEPITADIILPAQGPARPGGSSRGRAEGGGKSGGGGGGASAGGGGGAGMAVGLGGSQEAPPSA